MSFMISNEKLESYISEYLDSDETTYDYKRCVQDVSLTSKLMFGVLSSLAIKDYCVVKTHKRFIMIGLTDLNNVKKVFTHNFSDITGYDFENGMILDKITIQLSTGDKYKLKTNKNYNGNIEPFKNFRL
jgi:hypothetical protein